jgi:hypothetical protein
MAVWLMRIACWIPKAADTHLEHVILIAFPLHDGCMNVLQCYMYIAYIVHVSAPSSKYLDETETVPSAS